VTDDLDRQVRQALRRRKRSPAVVVIAVVLLVAIVAAGGFLWFDYSDLIRSASFAGQPAGAPVVVSSVETVTLKDFQSFQQQTAESLQSAAQDIAAQKADLKNLSNQVSALSAKIDAMQSAPQPPVSLSAPVELPTGSPQSGAPAGRASAIGARRKLPVPKTSGPISIGGAPLPPAAPADR
jgi:uncharacterized coiled-coil protein SlyX